MRLGLNNTQSKDLKFKIEIKPRYTDDYTVEAM
jgi:hypothetical protein